MTRQKWSGKSSILNSLSPLLRRFVVPPIYELSYSEFRDRAWFENVLNGILLEHGLCKLVCRSDSDYEDGLFESGAGKFESVLNLDISDGQAIHDACTSVFNSYLEYEIALDNTKVFLQIQIEDVSCSGVLFTRDHQSGAPYYLINYDDVSGKTDTVTSGRSDSSNKVLYVHRDRLDQVSSERFSSLLSATRELELHFSDADLDIEFVVGVDNICYLLQVRPSTLSRPVNPNVNEGKLFVSILEAEKKFSKLSTPAYERGQRQIFGCMSDWNPAEIIGPKPGVMSYSTYKFLVTDSTWLKARLKLGYRPIEDSILMSSFLGKPYIDVCKSFYSFLPSHMPQKIADKLVSNWLDTLSDNPQFHDKIEFSIADTCWTPGIKMRLRGILPSSEALRAESIYKEHFDTLLNTPKLQPQLFIEDSQAYYDDYCSKEIGLSSWRELLEDCSKRAVVNFAVTARQAFVFKRFMDCLVQLGYVDKTLVDNFLFSIETVTSDFLRRLSKYSGCNLDWDQELSEFRHLRPMTYDITAIRYDRMAWEQLPYVDSQKSSAEDAVCGNKINLLTKKLDEIFKEAELDISGEFFLDYGRSAIKGREICKLQFTRVLSDFYESLVMVLGKSDFSRLDIFHLDISDLLKYDLGNLSESDVERLRLTIDAGREFYETSEMARLPPLISRKSDFWVIPYQVSLPNFITDKCVQGSIKLIGPSTRAASIEIENKIVLLENADPGFDWIFGFNIRGLITKYGGINSHMAIRCAELGLPAGIGCGDIIFDKLVSGNYVTLDCKNCRINGS